MKKASTVFLQIIIILIGIGTLAFLLWEPHVEGRNTHATLFEIYFSDPFLAIAYLVSIAFFVALSRAFRLLGYIGRNTFFSRESVRDLRTIKYCAMILVAALAAGQTYLFVFQRGKDDIAGGVAMSTFLMFVFSVIAAAAAVSEKTLRSAVAMKSENDLTV